MSETLPLPDWNERQLPTITLADRHKKGRDYSVLASGSQHYRPYVQWVNANKVPLHESLRTVAPLTLNRLAQRGISLSEITDSVADITGQAPYPLARIVTAADLRNDPEYIASAKDMGFSKAMSNTADDWRSDADFEARIHFIRLRQKYIERAAKADVVGTVAYAVGAASLSPFLYMKITESDGGRRVIPWHGYAWLENDLFIGDKLDHAGDMKIAALTRQKLGYGQPATENLAEPYLERRGFNNAAVGAVALDIINTAAGNKDTLAIYRPLWAFMTTQQDPAARDELAAMVQKGTRGAVKLEELEAFPLSQEGMPLDMLRRVEAAAELDASKRPSHMIEEIGIY